MKLFAWVPGILGSRLERSTDRAEVWPPSPAAVNGLADRTFAELTDSLIATKVIDQVCIVPVYSPLDHMFVRAGITDLQPGQRPAMARLPFGYDWRMDIESQAALLADRLDAATAEGDEIVFVAHSMGNYLCRYLIETAGFGQRPFRSRVSKIVCVNGPHAGAPVILARMMGLDKMDHIVWADVPRIIAQAPFAGACQLLPAPNRPGLYNEQAAIDIYDPTIVEHFHWGAANVAKATQFWAELPGIKAQNVEYIIVRSYLDEDGAGASTIADVRWTAGTWIVEKGPGDGAVPPWSCEALGPADIVLPGEHLGVFDTAAFGTEVFEPHIASFVDAEFLAVAPSLKLQPVRRDVIVNADARFGLIQDGGERGTTFSGLATWLPLTTAGAVDTARPSLKRPVTFNNLKTATVIGLATPPQPGAYRVVLQGTLDGKLLLGNPAASVVVVQPAPATTPRQPPTDTP